MYIPIDRNGKPQPLRSGPLGPQPQLHGLYIATMMHYAQPILVSAASPEQADHAARVHWGPHRCLHVQHAAESDQVHDALGSVLNALTPPEV